MSLREWSRRQSASPLRDLAKCPLRAEDERTQSFYDRRHSRSVEREESVSTAWGETRTNSDARCEGRDEPDE
jgi:hypothetical protein